MCRSAGSWAGNFMRVQRWRNKSGSLRQPCGLCSFPITSHSVKSEVETLPRTAEAFASRRKGDELWHPRVYPLVIAASSACPCLLASDKVKSCFPYISCPCLFSLILSCPSLFPSHSLYPHKWEFCLSPVLSFSSCWKLQALLQLSEISCVRNLPLF